MKRTAAVFLVLFMLMTCAAALAEDPALNAARALVGDAPKLIEQETEHGYVTFDFREGSMRYEVICKDGVALEMEITDESVYLGDLVLTQAEAEAKLTEQRPGAVIHCTRTEREDARTCWKLFYILAGDACMAELDGSTGNLREETRLLGVVGQIKGAEEILAALATAYPNSTVQEINLELDEDRGLTVYDGEAQVSASQGTKGESYDFKVNAITGEILEWKRD